MVHVRGNIIYTKNVVLWLFVVYMAMYTRFFEQEYIAFTPKTETIFAGFAHSGKADGGEIFCNVNHFKQDLHSYKY